MYFSFSSMVIRCKFLDGDVMAVEIFINAIFEIFLLVSPIVLWLNHYAHFIAIISSKLDL